MDRRYKKRMDKYWNKMRIYAEESFSNLDPGEWFDYWHCHIDWKGNGNKHPENREASLNLGYEILKMAEKFKAKVSGPVQSWWFIHDDSYEDAVYLHSPNANRTAFPHNFDGVNWGKSNNEALSRVVDLNQFSIGTIVNEHGTTHVVVAND